MRIDWLVGGALAVVVAGTALGGDSYDALLAEYDAAQAEWVEQVAKLRESGDLKDYPPRPEVEFAPRFRELAEQQGGRDEALPALIWLVNNPSNPDGSNMPWGLEQIARQHANDPRLIELMPGMQYASYSIGRQPIVDFCESVLEESRDHEVRGGATFMMGVALYNTFAEGERDVPRAKKLFHEVADEYGDTAAAARIDGYLYEVEHLEIGMKAPNIVGRNPKGRKIRLSQFKGQVVVLDFWGFW